VTYPFEAYARQNLRIQSDEGIEWLVFCLNPDHQSVNPHCSFNVEKGLWYCFSCHARGNLNTDGNREEIDALRLDGLRARLNRMRMDTEEEQIIVPESMLKRYNVRNTYWDSRHLNQETQEMFELGFDTIADAATIPVRDMNGVLKGVTRRFMDPEEPNKYKYPKKFRAKLNVFASWFYEDYDMSTVYKTEGAIDAMRLWQLGYPAVAFYGNSVSPEQVRILLEMGVRKFVDCSDNDLGGQRARERSFGYWEKDESSFIYKPSTDMSKHFRMMTVTEFFGEKDIDAMSDEQIHLCLASAERHRIKKYVKRPAKRTQKRVLAHV
jgi:DNA primase